MLNRLRPVRLLAALTALGALAVPLLADAAPVISPFAVGLAASAYSASRTGGGSAQSAFNGGYWNAGTWGTHWIQADMGSSHLLSELRFAIDVMPYTYTWQKLYLSDTPIGNDWIALTPVAELVSHYTSQYERFTVDFSAHSGRYLQVVSYGGASWTAIGDGAPADTWIDPAGSGSHVPEPGSLALCGLALAVMGRRRARAV